MRFSIPKDQLYEALSTISGIIPQRSTLPILSSLLLEADNGRLRLTATDLDVYVVTDLDVDVEEDGVATIPGKRFIDIVKELPNELMTLSSEEGQTTLKCGRRLYRFVGMPPTEYPGLPTTLSGKGAEIPVGVLVRALAHTSFAISTDEARPNLQGALLQISKDRLRLVASDSHRLVRYDIPGRNDAELEAIVPLKTVGLLQRNLGNSDGMALLEMCGSYLGISYGRTRVYSRVIEGPFPDYEKVIPVGNSIEFKLDREAAVSALRRVAVLSHTQTRQIRVSIEPNELRISTNTPEVGDATESLDVEYSGDTMEIGFNATYLLEVLRHLGSDQVIVRLGSPTTAGLLEPETLHGKESYLCLVMPLRLFSNS